MRTELSAAGAGAEAAGRARVDGKFLALAARRFPVKGIAYGTFAPDAEGAQFPTVDRIAADFGQMAAAGFNTVRTYTAPPEHLLDEAERHGLKVMVGLPWAQHVAFLDDPQQTRQIRQEAVAAVRRLSAHPAALLFAVGNEIPPAVVRWHGLNRTERFLSELYAAIKDASPDSLLTYVNFPPTEFLDLECFDVCAFNVYLHDEPALRAYLARLQNLAGARPLLLAEAGADSIREGLEGQARLTAMQIRAAFAEGACGAVAFSWTDEWWRGGQPVEDWAFGLVDRDRRPKPALPAVAKVFAEAPFAPVDQERWPRVSVVVCAYNAGDTIEDCLQSLERLTYPHVEIIVVNDGSKDATGDIARGHERARVIDIPNGGLSAARNTGLTVATGEIVAYTDADVRVDPDWLTFLVQPILKGDFVGSGGPNIVPPDDPLIAQCVARAPGGPVHVLLNDRVAEHVPGCNMAFRRDALLGISGFNAVYLRAGDDVDVCWRLQAKGLRIGFAPSALVWHHHRQTVRAFYRQQVGYGECEAWLVAHHPEKFVKGQMLWRGRIYSPLPFIRSFTRSRINTGVWGTAPFPSVYSTGARTIELIPHSPGWMAASTVLILMGALGLLTPSHGAGWLLLVTGLAGWTTTLSRCAMFAWRSDLRGLPAIGRSSPRRSRLIYRLLIGWLHLVQPIARMRGRIKGVWSMPQLSATDSGPRRLWDAAMPSMADLRGSLRLLMSAVVERSYWSESWIDRSTILSELVSVLRMARPVLIIDVDDGWRRDRDISIAVGRWAWLHLSLLVEEHAEGRCLLRAGTRVRPSIGGTVEELALALSLVMAASAAVALKWPIVSVVSVAAAAVIAVRSAWQTAIAEAALSRALGRVTAAAGMMPLVSARAPSQVRWGMPARASVFQALTSALLFATVGLGAFSISRGALTTRPGPVTSEAAADPDVTANGGVAVGVSGDLFVADAQKGVIQRLRPRPPMDAALTATDLGTAGDPLLGNPVPFEAPSDIALAPNGDLYVADARNDRVTRIERATNKIVPIAGTGHAGFSGDGGRASRAALHGPGALAVAANGDLYIADTLNNRVRVVAATNGNIRTIAGDGDVGDSNVADDGPAVRAHLDRPNGLAVSPNGDVYVADTGHNRVRRISARTGLISTVAGNGDEGADGDGGPAKRASLAAPMGLALVLRGQQLLVYIADSLNDRVRVVDAAGEISTLGEILPVVSPVRIAYHPAGWLYVKDASPDGITAVAVTAPPRSDIATESRRSKKVM